MILDLLQKDYPREVTLLFGVRSEEDKVYFDFFESLSHEHPNFIFMPALSQPKETWNGIKGRVTTFLEQNAEAYRSHKVFICGSPVMIKDTRALLMQKGWEAKDIKLEIFV
jgi:NAD(P)H-flavin reductase